MKMMWIAFAAIGVIALASYVMLGNVGFSTAERTSGADVRLD